jgi:hypothetical protein
MLRCSTSNKRTSIQVSFLWLCFEVNRGRMMHQEVGGSGRGEVEELGNGVGVGEGQNARGVERGKV